MGAAWLILRTQPPWSYTSQMLRYLKRMKYYKFTRCLQICDLLECILVQQEAYESSWFQWAATAWMQVMLSLKDSRHGLSSIYSFVRHIEQSATFGTVGRCKVLRKHTVTFQPMLILPESFCRPHPCMRWRCWQLRFLQRRGGWRLQAMTCFSLIHYSTQSERRREKHCSWFDGRSSLTTSIEDCTRSYAFIRSLNRRISFI